MKKISCDVADSHSVLCTLPVYWTLVVMLSCLAPLVNVLRVQYEIVVLECDWMCRGRRVPSARFVLCKLSPSIESRPAELSPGIKCRCSRSSSTVLRVRASWSLPGLPGTLVLATFYCSSRFSR